MVDSWYPYLGPPLIGALVGYVTNYVAIKMLFRPLKAWRVLGLRVPMTPGVIPSRREILAVDIGRMVGEHLLPAGELARSIENEAFRNSIRLAVERNVDELLDRRLDAVASVIPEAFREEWHALRDRCRRAVCRMALERTRAPEVRRRVHRLIREHWGELRRRECRELLGEARWAALHRVLDREVRALQHSPALEERISRWLDRRLEEFLASDRPLRELLPEDLEPALRREAESLVPRLLERLAGMLHDPTFRRGVAEHVREGVRGFVRRLGFPARVLLLGMSEESLTERVHEVLEGSSAQLAASLRTEDTQARAVAFVGEAVGRFLSRPVGEVLRRLPHDKVQGAKEYLRRKGLAYLRGEPTREKLVAAGVRELDRWGHLPLGTVLDRVLPEGAAEDAATAVCARLDAYLDSPGWEEEVARRVGEAFDAAVDRTPIGQLSALLPAHVVGSVKEIAFHRTMALLRREVPKLAESLDVQAVVEERVNHLDLLEVERLVESVMKAQFKYINIFGALLGALIGTANVLLWLL